MTQNENFKVTYFINLFFSGLRYFLIENSFSNFRYSPTFVSEIGMAKCLESLKEEDNDLLKGLDSKESHVTGEISSTMEATRPNAEAKGTEMASKKKAGKQPLPCDYEWNDEKSEYLSFLLDDVVGTSDMVRYRQDYVKVRDHLYQKEQKGTTMKMFYTGSRAEGLSLPGSDDDFMIEEGSIKVVQSVEEVTDDEINCQVLLETKGIRPCFVSLRYTHDFVSNILVLKTLESVGESVYLSSFQFKAEVGHPLEAAKHSKIQGPSHETYTAYSDGDGDDFVNSLKCTTWPHNAKEWLHRPRKHGWPSKDQLRKFEERGCHVVPKGHPLSEQTEREWYMSFALTERDLVWSFNHVQMHSYAFLKFVLKEFIQKRMSEKALCSYFLKTIMFWSIEKMPAEFWRPSNFRACITHLLLTLFEHVEKGCLPHYFIPEYNLFEIKVTGVAQKQLMDILKCVLQRDIGLMDESTSLIPVWRKFLNTFAHRAKVIPIQRANLFIEAESCFMRLFSVLHCEISALASVLSLDCLKTLPAGNAFTEHTTKCALVHMSTSVVYPQMVCKSGNKEAYKCNILSCRLDFDALSVKLLSATYHLLSGNFEKCIHLIRQSLISLPAQYLYIGDQNLQDAGNKAFSWYKDNMTKEPNVLKRSKQAWVFDLVFRPDHALHVPAAVQMEMISNDPATVVTVSPLIYAYYLLFLSFHGLSLHKERDQVLDILIGTANDDEKSGCPSTRYHSFNIVGHCLWYAGRVSEAKYYFRRSIEETTDMGDPFGMFNSAWSYLDTLSNSDFDDSEED